jgi:hypothetical protein
VTRPRVAVIAGCLLLAAVVCIYGYRQPATSERTGDAPPSDAEQTNPRLRTKEEQAGGRAPDKRPLVGGRSIPSEWQGIAQQMAGTPATAEDWAHVRVESSSLPVAGTQITYAFAFNVLPLLEADRNVNARHARVGLTRKDDGGIVTSVWGRKMQKTLVVDWHTGDLRQREHSEAPGLELDEAPSGEKYAGSVSMLFGFSGLDQTPCISIGVQRDGALDKVYTTIPYEHKGFELLAPYAQRKYPVAAAPKVQQEPHGFVSIMLVDSARGALIGEIPLPLAARGTRPVFALDAARNILTVTGYDLNWVAVVDLGTYVLPAAEPNLGRQGNR